MNMRSTEKIAIIKAIAGYCKTSQDLEKAVLESVAMIQKTGMDKKEATELLEFMLSGKTLIPVAISANAKIDEEIFSEIISGVQKKHKEAVLVIDQITDLSISGGFKVRIQDELYDYSVDMRLNQLREKLVA